MTAESKRRKYVVIRNVRLWIKTSDETNTSGTKRIVMGGGRLWMTEISLYSSSLLLRLLSLSFSLVLSLSKKRRDGLVSKEI